MKAIRENRWTVVISVIWSILSLVFGKKFIENNYEIAMINQSHRLISYKEQIVWAILAYALAVFIIFLTVNFLKRTILNNGKERKILLYSIPLFLILISYFLSDISPIDFQNYYVGDEKNIWECAVRLYPFLFVYTSELFVVCFFLLPVYIAPSIIKIILSSLIMGYIIYRVKQYYKSNIAFSVYALCLLKPFLELGIRVHRMHWYGIIYMFVAVKLYFDWKERKELKYDWITIIIMSILISILTVLRREGLYLFVFGVALILLTYCVSSIYHIDKKNILKVLVIFFVCEAIIYYPAGKNGFSESGTAYRAILVHMLGEKSLDREKVSEELSIVDQWMDVSIIDKYNQEMGIGGFADSIYDWSWWGEGQYYAIRDNKTVSDEQFHQAIFDIIKKQPMVFIKSRVSTFFAAARRHDGYNLFFPLLLLLVILAYSLRQKESCLFVLCLGVLCHTGITALTMSASYFKYFWEMYLFAYFFILIIIIDYYEKSRNVTM